MTPDLGVFEHGVAVDVIPVVVGVDDPTHRFGAQGREIIEKLLRLTVSGSGVDNGQTVISDDNAHIEVERFIATPEDAFTKLIEHEPIVSTQT